MDVPRFSFTLEEQPNQPGFFMVDADPNKNPEPRNYGGVNFLHAKDSPATTEQYVMLAEENYLDFNNEILHINDLVRRGFGVLGFKDKNYQRGDKILIFHPKASDIAHKLFSVLQKKKRNHYHFGLLLGYYEPNVYAWCFGVQEARQAYPDLAFDEENKWEGYSNEQKLFMRNVGKHGLEELSPDLRQLALNEYSPDDDAFNAEYNFNEADFENNEEVQIEQKSWYLKLLDWLVVKAVGGGGIKN